MAKRRNVEANKKRVSNERAKQAQMKRGGGPPKKEKRFRKDGGEPALKFDRDPQKSAGGRKRPGKDSGDAPAGKRQKMDFNSRKSDKATGKHVHQKGKREFKPAGKQVHKKGKSDGKNGGKPGAPADGETRMKKSEWKAMIRERKGLHKKNFNLVQEVVFLWEKMRPRKVTTAQKMKLVTSILSKTGGKVAELVKNHRASRVIQFCLKEGSDIQRKAIMKEVKDNILDLAKDKYGRHLVLKLVNYVPKEHRGALVKIFGGEILTLLKHNYGADVVADLYYQVGDEEKVTMVLECYSKEVSLQQQLLLHDDEGEGEEGSQQPKKKNFDKDTALETVLGRLDSVRRTSIIKGLTENLNLIVEKGLLHPHLVHKLLMEFLLSGPTLLVDDMVRVIAETGDGILKIMHTKEGATSAVMVLGYGSSKVRKALVKGFKDYVKDAALDEWGHVVVLAALSFVDDTSLTNKIFIKEIAKNLKELSFSEFGSRVLLELVNPGAEAHMPEEIRSILHPKQRQVKIGKKKAKVEVGEEGEDVSELEEEEESEPEKSSEEKMRVLGQSLKDPMVRCKEVLGEGAGSLTSALLKLCTSDTGGLLRSQFGANVLVEVATGGGGPFTELAEAEIPAVHDAIIGCLSSEPEGGAGVLEEESDGSDAEENVEDFLDVSAEEGGTDEEESDSESDPLAEKLENDQSDADSDSESDMEEVSSEGDPSEAHETEEQNGGGKVDGSVAEQEDLQSEKTGARKGKSPPRHVLSNRVGRRALVRMVKASTSGDDGGGEIACAFVEKLWAQVFKGRCCTYLGKEAEIVVSSLLDCGVASVCEEVKQELESQIEGSLVEWAGRFQRRMEFDHSQPWKKLKNRRRKKEGKKEAKSE
ncbi:hypothetical protein BSKO_05423 [Bryopsis sp. KO-2023]|nr:hypothetical protein BSKO_05423 [Bryopsis sp. KO-2023]